MMKRKIFFLLPALLCAALLAGCSGSALDIFFPTPSPTTTAEPPRLSTLDVLVQRNAYGHQLGSFRTEGKVAGIGLVPMAFIHEAFLAL